MKTPWFLFFVFLIVSVLQSPFSKQVNENRESGWPIISQLVSIFFLIGITKIILALYDGKKADYDDLYKHYKLYGQYLLVHILYTLIVIGGLILFIIPGFI